MFCKCFFIKKNLFHDNQESCSFDDRELRREYVIKHARRLFGDSIRKIKDPKLTTKEQHLKNKPPNMLKQDWKYLVDYWSDPNFMEIEIIIKLYLILHYIYFHMFQEKSAKASNNRSCEKMPH